MPATVAGTQNAELSRADTPPDLKGIYSLEAR